MSALAPSMQAYFTDRLIAQRGASPNTIAAYRHTFRLLLRFATERTGTPPSELDIADLDAPLIAAFLDHLEKLAATASRPATTASRRSTRCSPTWRCSTPSTPHRSSGCSRSRQTHRTQPRYLPHRARGRRAAGSLRPDHLDRPTRPRDVRAHDPDRPADLRARRLTSADITLETGANVHTIGKGRKERRTPLVPTTRTVLKAWLKERAGGPDRPAVPDHHRQATSAATRSSAASRIHLATAAETARRSGPSTSRCTRSGTPPRCACCSPATTSP